MRVRVRVTSEGEGEGEGERTSLEHVDARATEPLTTPLEAPANGALAQHLAKGKG